MNVLQRVSIWLMSVALLALPAAASAYSYVMMEDAELFEQAEGVIVARVEHRRPAQDGDGETRYELRVLKVLAGPKLDDRQTLALPGTIDAPSVNVVIPGVPALNEGATILLFHDRRRDGVLQAMQLSLGVFGQVETTDGTFYVRQLEGSRDFSKSDRRQRYHAPRAASSFERWLADRARGIERAPDYLRPEIETHDATKFAFGIFSFSGQNPPPPGPGRWFQFDTDQSLPWRANPSGQANTTFDEFNAIVLGLAAWTNDPTSRITMSYGGTQADPGVCQLQGANPLGPFSGQVCWNDPNGLVSGSVTCPNGSGTLAIGGSFVSSNGQTHNGETWYPRSFAFVIVNDNAGCSLDGNNGTNGAELMTHEVGHAIAFAHSCNDGGQPSCGSSTDLNEAVMRPTLHGDGRGALLGVDDRAGAAIAYPQAGMDMTPPSVPANLAATPTTSVNVNVSWSASNDTGGSGLAGYKLERCEGAGCNAFAEISDQASTNVSDTVPHGSRLYRYRVRAYDAMDNRSAYSSIVDVTTPPLTNAVALTGLSGALNSQRFFTFEVPSGAASLVFRTSGGTGDADIYARFGTPPTTSTFDCISNSGSNTETCVVNMVQPGTYHVMILGFAAYTGLSVTATYSNSPPCFGNCIFRSGYE